MGTTTPEITEDQILEAIAKHKQATLVQISNELNLPPATGPIGRFWEHAEDPNLVYWIFDMSAAGFVDKLRKLVAENRVTMHVCGHAVYFIEGAWLPFPIGKLAVHEYTTPHWIPTALSIATQ